MKDKTCHVKLTAAAGASLMGGTQCSVSQSSAVLVCIQGRLVSGLPSVSCMPGYTGRVSLVRGVSMVPCAQKLTSLVMRTIVEPLRTASSTDRV